MADPSLVINALRTTPSFASMSDADVAAQLSATVTTPIPIGQFIAAVKNLPSFSNIIAAINNPNTDPTTLACCHAVADLLINFNGTAVDTTNAAFLAVVEGLVSAGVVSSADEAAVLALAQTYPCDAQVVTQEVTDARGALAAMTAAAAVQLGGS